MQHKIFGFSPAAVVVADPSALLLIWSKCVWDLHIEAME